VRCSILLGCEARPLLPAWQRNRNRPSTTWTIYKIAARQERLGIIEAVDEAAAIEKGAAEFKVPANRLLAIRR
jgi:hypothetical protein